MACENLITFSFEIVDRLKEEFITELDGLKVLWKDNGFKVSLFRDKGRPSRYYMMVLTKKSIDELSSFIQNQTGGKNVFEKIKESDGRVVISVFEQIL
jgi:hypothetical protein